jgi:uncharacterized flavoprotein (TIGR03862 family)
VTRPAVSAAVIGGGPAGLIAAEVLAAEGVAVTVYDQMPSVGRKLLMAGRGGLNLTHSEDINPFLGRYSTARLAPMIEAFPPAALIAWCHGLGQPTFIGSSGRVFPTAMKASPLLRAWLSRLVGLGVTIKPRHRWIGWAANGPRLAGPEGDIDAAADVTVLAVGGASWPRLGSDGAWTACLAEQIAPLRPANCGFTVAWSAIFRDRFAGHPLKRIGLRFNGQTARGEAMLTATGIEGGAVYALSAPLRDAIAADGGAMLHVDLRPDVDRAALADRLAEPRRGQSLPNWLRKQAGLSPEAIGLVQETLHRDAQPSDLAELIKALPLPLTGTSGLARAISSAGGLRWDALDQRLMLHAHPGVFAAGEMLDWEAPTGGYLLQACFSTGVAAAKGALSWLNPVP